jgi:signal transduction histidine kinase/CheY-like chemotaxis protein
MGLELLESEMQDQQKNNKDATSLLGNGKEDTKEDMEFWSTVVDDIKENAHVAVSILNDLLNYDKLETGTMKLELDPVNIWDLASKTVQQFQIQAINRRVDMRFELVGKDTQEIVSTYDVEGAAYPKHTKDGKRVVGDAVRLGQVLRNIISNALKFTPAEGSVIVMAEYIKKGLSHAKPVMDGEYIACNHPRAGSVRITVTDSGVGLTAEQLSQLFAEGVQFDANKLQHGGGSGLGLNIAKGIVEQHQGVIHAESQGANTGTTFVIELPLYDFPSDEVTSEFSDESKGSNDCAPTEATSDVSDSQNHDTTGPIKILVAEDSTSSRKMLIRLLERSGYECVPAANGQEAVDVIQKDLAAYDKDPTTHQMIDTVLMDFEMPLVTGPEATKKIRRMGYKGLVIGVTGNVLDEDIEFFMQRGADDVMPKPVSLKGLKSVWSKLAAASEGTGMKKSPSAQRLDDYVA